MSKIFSCEYCIHLSLTESEQRMLYNSSETKELTPHICKMYNKEVQHFAIGFYDNIIFPCIDCIKNQYASFEPRVAEVKEEEDKKDEH